MHMAIDEIYLRELIARPLLDGIKPPVDVSFLPPPPPYGIPKDVIFFWFDRSRIETRRLLDNLPEDANREITHEGGFEAMNGLQWLPSFSAYQYNSLCSRSSQMNIPTIAIDRLNLRPFMEDNTGSLNKILAERDVLCYFPNPKFSPREKVRKLIADQLNHWAEHAYGCWAVEPRLSNSLKGGWSLQYLPLFNRSFNVRSC